MDSSLASETSHLPPMIWSTELHKFPRSNGHVSCARCIAGHVVMHQSIDCWEKNSQRRKFDLLLLGLEPEH